jgi:serine/threonine-protein kinase
VSGARRAVSELDLLEEIGSGGFGTVYRARLRPHDEVAAKVLDRDDMEDWFDIDDWDTLKDHLFKEADNLKAAEHDHVVRVHSVHYDEDKSAFYIVTELCDGSVDGEIANGPLRLDRAHQVVRDSLLGLEALHTRGMVHRDLKPGNLLLKGNAAKLSDFGLVTDRLILGYASRQGYTDHLAPEVFDVSVTSPKTDVWAMGMTAFRMLNGLPWYEEEMLRLGVDRSDPLAAKDAVEELVTSGRFSARLQWMPHVPRSWRRFVNKALHHNSAHRYSDGGEMLSAMERADLPTRPSWECRHEVSAVTWTRQRGNRVDEVVWTRHSARRHEFVARSAPKTGTGLTRTLSAHGVCSRSEIVQALENFFAVRTT